MGRAERLCLFRVRQVTNGKDRRLQNCKDRRVHTSAQIELSDREKALVKAL
nr:MAG TPA: hypothetical protein [Caudoviricetes sp.]